MPERIIKLPKKSNKKKLKDLTPEEWERWKAKNCGICNDCIFTKVYCDRSYVSNSWINNKELYSKQFLNQEIEVD